MEQINVAVAKEAFNGEIYCGDATGHWGFDDKIVLCVIDGLGHGMNAELAANAAVGYVSQNFTKPIKQIFDGCDREIRHTRGVAMGIAIIDQRAKTLTYGGIGNTRIFLIGPEKTYRPVSSYGIVGGRFRHLLVESFPIEIGNTVLMFTDGIPESMKVDSYEKLLKSNMKSLASNIIEEWGRAIDDRAVLAFRMV